MLDLEYIDTIAAVKSKSGKYLSVSNKFYQACQYPEKDAMIGITDIEICQYAYYTPHYDSTNIAEEFIHEDEEVLRGKHLHLFETVFIQEKLFFFLVNKSPIIINNKIEGSVFNCIDLGKLTTHEVKSYLSIPNIKTSQHTWQHLKELDIIQFKQYNLTHRQWQCLSLLIKGYSAKMIALELIISKKTVEFHIGNIKEKVGVKSTSELIAKTISEGIVSSESMPWRHSATTSSIE